MLPENYFRHAPAYLGFSAKEEELLCNLRDRDFSRSIFPLSAEYERLLSHRVKSKIPKLLKAIHLLHSARNQASLSLKNEIDAFFADLKQL